MSNLMHKIKDDVSSYPSNTAPHNPNIATNADPRVDSTRVPGNGNAFTATAGTTGVGGPSGVSSTAPYQNTTYGSATEHGNPRSTNAGPHASNIANRVDPRVDATRGQHGSTGMPSGGYSNPHSTNTGPRGSNVASMTASGTDSNYNNYGATGGVPGGYDNPRSTNAGPHGSNVANMADPRVDSDRSKVGTASGMTSSGVAHGGMASGGYNVDNSNVTTKTGPPFAPQSHTNNLKSGVAPAGSSYTTPGSGTAQHTAGPHHSDLLNKLDPRVDSNLDNSRTIGRDATRS